MTAYTTEKRIPSAAPVRTAATNRPACCVEREKTSAAAGPAPLASSRAASKRTARFKTGSASSQESPADQTGGSTREHTASEQGQK